MTTTKEEKGRLVRKLRTLCVCTACCANSVNRLLAQIENPVFDPRSDIEAIKKYSQAMAEIAEEL